MTEWQALLDAVFVGRIDHDHVAQGAAALRLFALQKMSPARARAQHLATGGDLKPLRHRFLCLNAFGTSHKCAKLSLEKSAKYKCATPSTQGLFSHNFD